MGARTLWRSLAVVLAVLGGTASAADPSGAGVHRTSGCAKFGQPEFSFVAGSSTPDVDVQWLTSTLEAWVAGGQRFKSGETMLLGSIVTRLSAVQDGTLRIMEPDMQSVPLKFVDSVERTLLTTRVQLDTARSFKDARPRFAPINGGVYLGSGLDSAKAIRMVRTAGEGGFTGWLIVDAATNPDEWAKQVHGDSVYQVMIDHPQLMKFLALPEDYSVLVNAADPRKFLVFEGADEIKPLPGSFLADYAAAGK